MSKYSFAENLRMIREEKEMSQRELATILRVSHSTVSSWETSSKYPTIDRVYDIARALGVPVTMLVK